MSLSELLISLSECGCYPSIYRRGNSWRAHVNAAGGWWADGPTPFAALDAAVQAWKSAGWPMDGMAAEEARAKGD